MYFSQQPEKVTVRQNPNNPDFCSVVLCDNIKSVSRENEIGEVEDGFTADIISLVDVRYYSHLKNSIEKEFDVWVEAGKKQLLTRNKSDKQIIKELQEELKEKDLVISDLIQVLVDNEVIW